MKILMKRFLVTTIIILLALTGGALYYYEGSLPLNKNLKTEKVFVIPKGTPVNDIVIKLEKEDLIRNKLVFFLIIKQLGIENQIQAGSFRLSPSMSAKEIALGLTKGSSDIWITIIEGLRKEEIAQILSSELGIPATEIIKSSEEGKLFPDTYLFPQEASVSTVLGVFERNYNLRFDEKLRARARAKGLTENQVLTIASMVEREANSRENKRKVASIIYKRWLNDWPLQIDATVQYILGYQEDTDSWWKRNLTKADLSIDSPYNTYLHPGLPPGPISNPGIDAIEAVIDADENIPYWYYISNSDGSQMIYSKTLDEHNAAIDRHLR